MDRIRKMVRERSLLLMVALIFTAAAFFVLSLPNAEALSGPYLCTYYKDATHKKIVGSRGVGCCGETISWGTTTLYFRCESLLCADVLCPN